MQKQAIINSIVAIPSRFYKCQKKSISDLLKESLYSKRKEEISAADIRDYLHKEPKYIPDWIKYSNNKRGSEGWYIAQERGEYIVGYFSIGSEKSEKHNFLAVSEAVAFFIKKELDSIKINSSY